MKSAIRSEWGCRWHPDEGPRLSRILSSPPDLPLAYVQRFDRGSRKCLYYVAVEVATLVFITRERKVFQWCLDVAALGQPISVVLTGICGGGSRPQAALEGKTISRTLNEILAQYKRQGRVVLRVAVAVNEHQSGQLEVGVQDTLFTPPPNEPMDRIQSARDCALSLRPRFRLVITAQ